MSRSRKDGRRGGAHRHGHDGAEIWSKRPTKYPMADCDGRGNSNQLCKADTHRHERLEARAECAELLKGVA